MVFKMSKIIYLSIHEVLISHFYIWFDPLNLFYYSIMNIHVWYKTAITGEACKFISRITSTKLSYSKHINVLVLVY